MADAAAVGHGPSLRIDKFLWFARLSKSRSVAQALAEDGHIRLNGRRIDRAHAPVRAGDLITFPHPSGVRPPAIPRSVIRRPDPSEPDSDSLA